MSSSEGEKLVASSFLLSSCNFDTVYRQHWLHSYKLFFVLLFGAVSIQIIPLHLKIPGLLFRVVFVSLFVVFLVF